MDKKYWIHFTLPNGLDAGIAMYESDRHTTHSLTAQTYRVGGKLSPRQHDAFVTAATMFAHGWRQGENNRDAAVKVLEAAGFICEVGERDIPTTNDDYDALAGDAPKEARFELRLPADLKAWLLENGGADTVRQLIQAARERQKAKRESETA